MNEPFNYIYDRGGWVRDNRREERWEMRKISETVIGGLVMAFTLVLVMISWLCM